MGLTMNYQDDIELLRFRRIVEDLARDKTGEIYANTGEQHAKIVVEKLLNSAQKTAVVYSGCLDAKVHDLGLYEALVDRIGAENVRVVVSGEPGELNHELISFLQGRNAEVRKFEEIGTHLIVVDGAAFRVEDNLKDMKALFAFGGDRPKLFQKTFERIWGNATKLGDAPVAA